MAASDKAREAMVLLPDGAKVRLRAARAEDGEPLRRMFFGLSDATRYFYFCAGVPCNDVWAERFVSLGRAEGDASYALVVEAGEVMIGVARFDRSPDGRTAEIGLLLADAWQSRGLGRYVLDQLSAEAQRRAVTAFTGYMLWENRRMLRLARRAFAHMDLDCAQGGCLLTAYLA